MRRARKLTAEATIWVLIALNVYTHLAVGHVLRKVSQRLRFIWPDPTYRVPGAASSTGATSSGPRQWWHCMSASRGPSPPHRRRGRSASGCA
jgi:hypothetical protein